MTQKKGRFALHQYGIIVNDLAGWTKLSQRTDDLVLIEFLDAYYALCHAELTERGARVLKFMGDSCMAIIEPDRLAALIVDLPAIHERLEALSQQHGLSLKVSTNVHLARVAAGDLGPADNRRYDVIGSGVNHTFLMGRSPGIRISEPAYRQLPNQARSLWSKHRPPATYSFSETR